jgi:hypothetical protein
LENKMNAKALIEESITDAILGLEEDELSEPTNEELQRIIVPNDRLEMAWCGGSKNRGCGNRINLFTIRYENGFGICPHCGKRN